MTVTLKSRNIIFKVINDYKNPALNTVYGGIAEYK